MELPPKVQQQPLPWGITGSGGPCAKLCQIQACHDRDETETDGRAERGDDAFHAALLTRDFGHDSGFGNPFLTVLLAARWHRFVTSYAITNHHDVSNLQISTLNRTNKTKKREK
jgi:hypothetical protein